MADPVGFRVVHHVDGPRVRLGIAWFVVAVGAALASRTLLALVMAAAGALAADEVVRIHRCARLALPGNAERAQRFLGSPERVLAVIVGTGLPVGAAAGSDTMAAFAALSALLALTLGLRGLLPLLSGLTVGVAAASPVLLAHLGSGAAVALLVLVAAYDAGDFIVGTGASTSWEGPAAGVTAVAVLGFATVVVAQPPLEEDGSATLAVLVALLAPLGPPLASVLVGDGATPARFVRRLDSLLLVGPLAAFAMAGLLPRL